MMLLRLCDLRHRYHEPNPREEGAETVMVASPEYVFARENPLYEALISRLGK